MNDEGRMLNGECPQRLARRFRGGEAPWVLVCAWVGMVCTAAMAAETNLIDPDAIPPLRPAHGEIPASFWEQHGGWVIAGGVVLVLLMAAAVWWLARPKPAVIVPPEQQARQDLEALRQQPETGELLTRVSRSVHRYFAAAFHLAPGEFTTGEFCRELEQSSQVGPELASAVSRFLRQCDQRKFSPPVPAPPLSAVNDALGLVDRAQTRVAALAKPPPEDAGKAA